MENKFFFKMVSTEEKGPFNPQERLSILKSLHNKQKKSLTSKMIEITDINKKVESPEDSDFKKKFMVFQWFNKLKYSGNKIKLPIFSFEDMVTLKCIDKEFPKKIKSIDNMKSNKRNFWL